MRKFSPARKRAYVSPGESLRIVRELQALTQTRLSELCGIPRSTISDFETGRAELGVERAIILAIALRCDPAVLASPGWQAATRLNG